MRNTLTALLVLWALVLTACAPSTPYSIASGAPPGAETAIDAAAASWNVYLKPEYRLRKHSNGGWVVFFGDTGVYNGVTKRADGIIAIRPEPINSSVYAVAMHEFGHALGLDHPCQFEDQPSWHPAGTTLVACDRWAPSLGLMDPTHGGAFITQLDLDQCRERGMCP